MKFSELVRSFETYTGIIGEVENSDLSEWFNEAQLDLALYFGPIKTVEITPVSGILSPPPDTIKIIEITGSGESIYYRRTGGGQIYVGTDQPVSLVYRAMPDPAHVFDPEDSDPDKEPDLPFAVHYLLSIYATAMYWYRESEGDPEEMALANFWLAKYNAGISKFIKLMDRAGDDIDHWVVIE